VQPSKLVPLSSPTYAGTGASLFGKLTGVLAPGMRADVVLVDAERLEEPAAAEDATMLDLLIARGLGSDVRTVLVDGEVVLDEGTHTWIDRPTLVAELRAVARQHDRDPGRQETGDFAKRLARLRQIPQAGLPPAISLGPRCLRLTCGQPDLSQLGWIGQERA
jgi:hypothetical protein